MIDYVKIEIPPEYGHQLEAHPCLSFMQYRTDDGELKLIRDDKTGGMRELPNLAEYRGMTFKLYPSGRMTLHGSWHKYFHGGTNWQDFTLEQFRKTVREFCDTFNLDPLKMKLLQLEAGVNVVPPLSTRETLRAFVCNRTGDAFCSMRSDKCQPLGLELYLNDYGLKVYDKGAQYGLYDPLMRFERKYTRWCKFSAKFGIQTLSDLLHSEAWNKLADHLLDAFDALILREPSVQSDGLPPTKRLFFSEAGRAGYWWDATPKQRQKARARLRRIITEYGSSNLHEVLRSFIADKLNELIHPGQGQETWDVFHDISADATTQMGDVFHQIKPVNHDQERGCFPTSFNGGIHSPQTGATLEGQRIAQLTANSSRRCRSCGRDISIQRPGSVFCSERLYGRDAKRCRNADSNPRNHDLRKLQRITANPLLFDHSQYLRAIRHYQPQT